MSLWRGVSEPAPLLHQPEGKGQVICGLQATPFGNTAIITDPAGCWLPLQETPPTT